MKDRFAVRLKIKYYRSGEDFYVLALPALRLRSATTGIRLLRKRKINKSAEKAPIN